MSARFPQWSSRSTESKPFEGATSYPCHVVTVHHDAAEPVQLFVKDFSTCALPKDDAGLRRERERLIYRDVLPAHDLGTAFFYGEVWDPAAKRYWLVLEYVPGLPLGHCDFSQWPPAAGWLGRLQGRIARGDVGILSSDLLIRHDVAYFANVAQRAHDAVTHVSPQLGARVIRVIRDHDEHLVPLMVDQPATLVHGSFRPNNILVSGPRICPIDWELAAVGSTLYDFAFIADGFDVERLQVMWQAYCEGFREAHASPPPNWGDASVVIDCFRLHKLLKYLVECVSWNYPAATVEKIVGKLERLHETLATRVAGRRS